MVGFLKGFLAKVVLLIGAASIVALAIFISAHYDNNQAVAQDTVSADVLLKKKAEQGDTEAQITLGTMYLGGQEVPRDDAKAAKWFSKAAERGNAAAQGILAFMYRKGRGVSRDYAKSLKWYGKSASQNYAKAQFGLGRMHALGLGTPKDAAKAERWYRLAAEQGHLMAMNNLAFMWAENNRNLDEAEKFSRATFEKEPGNASWLDTLGWVLHKKGDHKAAVEMLERAVAIRSSNRMAWSHLGIALLGAGDIKKSTRVIERAKTLYLPANQRDILKDYRVQTSMEAATSVGGYAGSACIAFDPPLKRGKRIRYDDYVDVKPALRDLVIAVRNGKLCIDGLSFGEEYKISLLPGLPSGDGIKTLIKDGLSVFISNRKRTISFRERGYVLPRYGNQIIPLETVNAQKAKIKVLRIAERNLVNKLRSGFLGSLDSWDVGRVIEKDGSLVFEGTVEFPERLNKSVVSGLKVEELIGRKLETGIYIIVAGKASEDTSRWRPETTQWLVVSDIGTSLFRGPDGLHVLTRSLDSAEPLAGVTVSLVAKNNRELAKSVSDPKGYAHFAAPLLNGAGGDEPVLVRTESPDGGFSFVSLKQRAFDLRDRGVAGREVPGPVDAYVSTERGIYRPGETVHLTAFVRDGQGKALEGKVPMTLRLIRPDGVEVDRRILQDAGGSSYVENLPIDPNAHMGEWNARLYLNPKEEPIGSVSFQVADFVPPKIEVKAEGVLAPQRRGAKISLSLSADYFFGAPADGLRVKARARLRARRSPYSEWEGFFFGLEEETFDPIMINIEEGKLDEAGKATLSASLVEYPDVTVPLDIEIWARVFELGGRARTAKVAMPLNNLEKAIGIRPLFDKGRVAEGARAMFEVVALNRNGKSGGAENLEYTFYKEHRDYTWFRRSGAWDYEVFTRDEEIHVGSLAVSAGSLGKIGMNVEWGAYRLEVRDTRSEAASSHRFHAGWGGSASGPDRPDSLRVELDRKEYRAGDTAKLFISPPFPGKLVLVVAGKELEIFPAGDITREGKSVEIPINGRWAAEPGIYVMPIVFRPGDLAMEQQPGRAVGVAWMGMDASGRKLNVSLNTPEEVRSGQQLTVLVDTASPDAETFVSLAAVDDAVLGLTNYQTPNPFLHFFAQRRLGYEVRDTYGYLINPYGAERAAVQSGGDESTGRLDQGLSTRSSKVVSLFSDVVRTNAEGKTEISFEVPQFSGRLRIMAVAWNGKQLGSAESKVQVRDPVFADLVLPRFLAPGDRALAAATFNNFSGEAGTYEVNFTSKGPVMLDGKTSWEIKLGIKENFNVEVPLVGSGIGAAGVSMRVKGPGGYEVEKSWDLAVRPIQPITAEKTFVRLKKGEEKTLTADLVQPYLVGTESVTLSVGSIPSFGVQALVDDLMAYPYRCLEQTTSRAMAFLFGTGRYPSAGSAKEFPDDFTREIRAAISRLTTLQRRDGSFGLWSSFDYREKWLSAYAADFLVRAKKIGFRVPDGLYRSALTWLRSSVQGGYFRGDENISSAAYAHYVLARANKGNPSKLRHFFDNYKDRFPSPMESAFAASALASYGDTNRSEQANKNVLEWIPTAMKKPDSRYDYYSSPVRQVAAVLHLTAEADLKDAELNALANRFAKQLASRKHFSTQESAWISMAALSIERWTKDYRVEANGQLWKGPGPTRMRLGSGKLKQGFSVKNVGMDDATYEIAVRGIKGTTLPPTESGFSIKRELIGEDGKAVSLADVKQGDVILARLTGKVASTSGRWTESQALIVDLLPAGLEIETVNVDESIFSMPKDVSWKESDKLFVKGRDDRYVAALKLSGGDEFGLQYLVRAVTPGSYAFPAPYVENMYRPDRFARGKVSRLEIRR